jgi:hypothetical protein
MYTPARCSYVRVFPFLCLTQLDPLNIVRCALLEYPNSRDEIKPLANIIRDIDNRISLLEEERLVFCILGIW